MGRIFRILRGVSVQLPGGLRWDCGELGDFHSVSQYANQRCSCPKLSIYNVASGPRFSGLRFAPAPFATVQLGAHVAKPFQSLTLFMNAPTIYMLKNI